MNVLERMRIIDSDKKIADFRIKQKQDYEFKRNYMDLLEKLIIYHIKEYKITKEQMYTTKMGMPVVI